MTTAKRAMDLLLCVAVLPLALPLGLIVAVAIRAEGGGGGVLYGSERMGQSARPFTLWKFRTMRPGTEDGGVSGGAKTARVTRVGRVLRRFRLDELPQLWNILNGEMSLVGPRPPLRRYVERFPRTYAAVLTCRPGIAGLATLIFHRREAALLALCETPEETDAIYARRCVPVKARLDLIYRARQTVALDLWILWRTGLAVLGWRTVARRSRARKPVGIGATRPGKSRRARWAEG